MDWFVFLIGLLFGVVALYLLRHGGQLASLWREPILRYPVVIFESDDWGPAAPFEADRLQKIIDVLTRYQDREGRHPVMTLGVVLSVPDTEWIRKDRLARYHALYLDAPRFLAIRETTQKGLEAGVFSLQLHGMAHFLPETLLKAVPADPMVLDWLTGEGIPDPVDLPSPLQSRWTDCSVLPCRALDPEVVQARAEEEVGRFREIFGENPVVAVPPTFIWNEAVEGGWARAGVRYVVTPGRRYCCRDAKGKPVPAGPVIRNGQRGSVPGIHYLVRDSYFEPAYGHKAAKAVERVAWQTSLGRPALFETHRFNFNRDEGQCNAALSELSAAIGLILKHQPQTRFLTSAELAAAMAAQDPLWIERRWAAKLRSLICRARAEMPLIRRWFPLRVGLDD